jgi:hypothetical protein
MPAPAETCRRSAKVPTPAQLLDGPLNNGPLNAPTLTELPDRPLGAPRLPGLPDDPPKVPGAGRTLDGSAKRTASRTFRCPSGDTTQSAIASDLRHCFALIDSQNEAAPNLPIVRWMPAPARNLPTICVSTEASPTPRWSAGCPAANTRVKFFPLRMNYLGIMLRLTESSLT